MSRVKSRDTTPELAVRRLVFALGFRYRLHRRDLPGTPDLVFVALKKVIFVHGCFWHFHHCRHFRFPSTRKAYWTHKLTSNQRRDALHRRRLRRAGWDLLVIWECQLRRPKWLKTRLLEFLHRRPK